MLFVDVRGARGLRQSDWPASTGPHAYAEVSVAGQRRRTAVAPAGADSHWGATFEFFNCQLHDTLKVKVRRGWESCLEQHDLLLTGRLQQSMGCRPHEHPLLLMLLPCKHSTILP